MNQALQTHFLTPLFASAVHPCPMPYARVMPKKAEGTFEVWSPSIASTPRRIQEKQCELEEQKLLEKYGSILCDSKQIPTFELDSSSEEIVQSLSELLTQKYQEYQEESFLWFHEAINANYDLSAIVKSEEVTREEEVN
jgi:hypothetical protein